MSKTVLVLFIAFFLCLFQSCSDKVEEAVNGWWSIDTLYYQGYDTRMCLYSNVITLKNDHVFLPTSGSRCEGLSVFDKSGTWRIARTDSIPLLVSIETTNEIFAGTHQVIFRKDVKNKLLKMEIKSTDLYVVARKGLFDYNGNTKRMDYLVKQSQSRNKLPPP